MAGYPYSDLDATILRRFYAPRPDPLPIPTNGMFDDPAACVRVNRGWAGHIIGVLDALDQIDAWQGTSEQIDAARGEIQALMIALSATCEEPFMEQTAILEYRTDPNTNGGSAAVGMNTIPLTIYSDPDGLINDLDGGEFYLNPGYYRVRFAATAYRVDRCQTMLRGRISDNTFNAIEGISAFSGAGSTTSAALGGTGVLDISIPMPTLWLATYAQTAAANFGLGVGLTDITIDNVFAWMEIRRVEAL